MLNHNYTKAGPGQLDQLRAASQQSSQNNAPAPSPAQTTTEFAFALLEQAKEANGRLEALRNRLFGDLEDKDPEPRETKITHGSIGSLFDTVAAAHFSFNRVIEQLRSIESRL